MKKNEFLLSAVEAFLSTHTKWQVVHEDKRQHLFYVGRDLSSVFVHLGFSARTDRDLFGQSVGWSPDRATFADSLTTRSNPPIRLRDGQLKRLQMIERPRDFDHEELSFPTAALARSISGFRLAESSYDEIREQMLREIDEYALPYLCMMLSFRHGLQVSPEQLANGEVT